MDKIKTAAVIAFFILAFGIVGCMDKQDALRQEQRIEEDSPFWDCTTSGNYKCGPQWPIQLR